MPWCLKFIPISCMGPKHAPKDTVLIFQPIITCSLYGLKMEGWCIALYVIVHISVCGWAHGRVVEYTLKIKLSETRIFKMDPAPKCCRHRRRWWWMRTMFCCDRFGGLWNSNGVCMATLWSFCGYNIVERPVNSTFTVSWSHRRAMLHHLGCL